MDRLFCDLCACLCVSSPEPVGEAAQALSDSDQTPDKNKKKNRCFACRKKVGLTGKEEKKVDITHIHTEESRDGES